MKNEKGSFGKLFRKTFFSAAVSVMVSVQPVHAAQYDRATMDNLIPMLFNMGGLNLNKIETFSEFMKVASCDIYREFSDKEFDWKEIHKQFLAKQDEFKENKPANFRILTDFLISGYSFDSMSFEISPDTAVKRVRAIAMNQDNFSICENMPGIPTVFKYLPRSVVLNLEVPLSLYHIPVSAAVAESIVNNLNKDRQSKLRLVYATVFVTVETVKKKDKTEEEKKPSRTVDVFGYVKKITFYSDEERRKPFKTLYYN